VKATRVLWTLTCEQRVQRQHAGTLGLIGLSVVERGRWDRDGVIVLLGADLIGVAIGAADHLPQRD
jgi:hypothetical protein